MFYYSEKNLIKPKPKQLLHPTDTAVDRTTDDAPISKEKDRNKSRGERGRSGGGRTMGGR